MIEPVQFGNICLNPGARNSARRYFLRCQIPDLGQVGEKPAIPGRNQRVRLMRSVRGKTVLLQQAPAAMGCDPEFPVRCRPLLDRQAAPPLRFRAGHARLFLRGSNGYEASWIWRIVSA